MSWRDVFDRAADAHGASPRTSCYVDLRSFEFHRDAILAWLGTVDGQRILDAGCGVGAFVEPLVARNTVYGVDFSGRSLPFARERGLLAVCADLEALPLAADSFDVVLCISVVQILRDPEPALRNLARALRPGGTLVVAAVNGESLVHNALARLRRRAAPLQLHSIAHVSATLARCGIVPEDRLHLYYPLRVSTRPGRVTWSARRLSTSFVVRGRKEGAGSHA